jgi:hypothetical protein
MKKKIFLFAVAALALAACSNDETVTVNQSDAISFRPLMSNVTRAADATLGTTGSFKATAFKTGETTSPYFDEVVFTGTGGTYTSAQKYYWPAGDGKLDFYAWSPSNLNAGANDYNNFTITPSTTVANQIDFVYAVTKGWGKTTRSGGNGVAINFRHAESKIKFNVQNTNNNLKITVGTVTIKNLRGSETFSWNGVTNGTTPTAAAAANTDGQYTSGVLTYLNGTWTKSSAQTAEYTTPAMYATSNYNVLTGIVAAKDIVGSGAASDYDMILIPQALKIETTYASGDENAAFEGACILVQLKIQNKEDGSYIIGSSEAFVTAMWPLTALTWLPGHQYTYTIDLAGGGFNPTNTADNNDDLDPILEGSEIKFVTVTVDNWETTGVGGVYVTGL